MEKKKQDEKGGRPAGAEEPIGETLASKIREGANKAKEGGKKAVSVAKTTFKALSMLSKLDEKMNKKDKQKGDKEKEEDYQIGCLHALKDENNKD